SVAAAETSPPPAGLYESLREAAIAETFPAENITLARDVAEFRLTSGTLSFGPALGGRVTLAVFSGQGELRLSPPSPIEQDYLQKLSGKNTVQEPFTTAVFYFTDDTYQELIQGRRKAEPDSRAAEILKNCRHLLRSRNEAPRTLSQSMVNGEMMDNLEAEVLTDLLGPKRPGLFTALLSGRKYEDLRFHLRPRGAISGALAPEEVVLLNIDTSGHNDGILYWSHLITDNTPIENGAHPGQRFVHADEIRIQTTVEKNEHLTATTRTRLTALVSGERVLKLSLLPSLRVSRATLGGQAIPFIQEPRKANSTLYVVLPQPILKGTVYDLELAYQGDRVIDDAGGGNYAVGARTSWYPTVNPFADWSTYQLSFRIPNKYRLVSIGNLVSESKDGDFTVSEWQCDTPVPVAGFNFGQFKQREHKSRNLDYAIHGYAATELPTDFRTNELLSKLPEDTTRQGTRIIPDIGGLNPSLLLERILGETEASIRIYNRFFGPLPYGHISITQQPQANFGQSWPTLLYLPLSAFLDSTQRVQMGGASAGLTNFVNEVTAHEVAHQWWGHRVGWATFHDQWLSEGFAQFSASLYVAATNAKPAPYLQFWDELRNQILSRTRSGVIPNDAGPVWLGLQLATQEHPDVYANLVYPKGAYILHMLRWMMRDPQKGDQAFIDLMHDFVATYANRAASSENFQAVVEKHMLPAMDLERNHRMDWFFRSWLYGTEVPRYQLEYTVENGAGEQCTVKAKVTQSDVSKDFLMLVPIYADFDGQFVKLGALRMVGPTTVDNLAIPLPRRPKRILLNAYYDVLAKK
ncbi:MAG: M1 family aminopeptidase, partial [Acidobacteria bacterium]|nr:M1 family aminopeptidase [Acidobacteriota bacterium]